MVTKTGPRWVMPYPICPNCGYHWTLDSDTYNGYEGPIACRQCRTKFRIKISEEAFPLQEKVVWIHPMVDTELLEGLVGPKMPQEIYDDYEAALYCFGAGVPPRAVAVMCRYTIQHALIVKGIPEDAPEKMLNVARSKGVLSQTAANQAHASVFMGGKGGHPQGHWVDEVSPEDAKQAVLFTKRVLVELFIGA